jgi:hypothetical protein
VTDEMKYIFESLDYCPEEGVFLWKYRPRHHFQTSHHWKRNSTIYAGKAAGTRRPDGYIQIKLGGKKYFAHRLAYLFMTKSWPIEEIDHINHDRTDNRWSNIRAVSRRENGKNHSKNPRNTSGYTGVSRTKWGTWRCSLRHEGQSQHIGTFDTLYEAAEASRRAYEEFGFHENHGK